MYFSEELIEEIRQRNDIVDVISGYVKLQKKGSSYFGLCPFHNEKSPSFSVSPSKQMYFCFGCGVGGNVFTFIMEYENYSFMEALKLAAIETHVADARTCCLNPATTTHRQMTEAQLRAAGVPAGLVRMSCGLESKEDLIADIEQALEQVK